MITERLYRSFWNVYGRFVWDREISPLKKRVILTVVDVLKKQSTLIREHVLDAGCGTGHYAIALAEAGFQVTGIDYSSGMLTCAASKVTSNLSNQLSFQQLDLNHPLTYSDSTFHHIISISTLWTVADPVFTLKELVRVLKPGGTLIVVQVPKPDSNFFKTINNRLKQINKKNLGTSALVFVKVFLERTRATKYWAPEELIALLLSSKQLKISYVDNGPPTFIVGMKISVHNSSSSAS